MRNQVSHSETRKRGTSRYTIRSLAQGLEALERLGGAPRGLTLMELARSLRWGKATAFRYLSTLVAAGYLDLDGDSRRYRPTVRVLRLGGNFLARLSLTDIALPHLEALSRRLGETTNMAVLDEAEVVYVARVGGKRILSTNLGVGSRLPAHCTSMGKVLLAWLPEAERERILSRARLEAFTPQTLSDPARLREALRAVRRQGYALNDQELDLGLRSCAAPVIDARGAAVAAINASFTSARFTRAELEKRAAPAIVAAARAISEVLVSRQ